MRNAPTDSGVASTFRDSRSSGQTRVIDWLWSIAITGVVALSKAVPVPAGNELIYATLLETKADPSYLAGDWTFGSGFTEQFLFDLVLAPVAQVLDLTALVWVLRILTWLVSARLLVALGRRIDVPPAGVAVSVAIFIGAGESLGVGAESMIAGFEAKMVAWPLLLGGLLAAIDRRILLSGALVGVCVSFHTAIGLWGGGALLLALLLISETRKRALQAIPIAFLLSLAGVVPVLLSLANSSMSETATEFIVLQRLPHHLDPFFFGERGPFVLALMLGFNLMWCYSRRDRYEAKLLGVFQGALLVVVGLGVAARLAGVYEFLLLHPFRVLPVVAHVLFWLTAISLALETRDRRREGHSIPVGDRRLLAVSTVAALSLFVLWNPVSRWVDDVGDLSEAWQRPPTALEEVMTWVSENTDEDAVIASPPWEDSMFYLTERAQLVSWGGVTYDRAEEWMERLSRTLDDDMDEFFSREGRDESDWQTSYEGLDESDWVDTADDFGVSYVITTADYDFPLLYSEGDWRLYEIS